MDENNNNIVQEILHDLFSSMEALETQNTAILQFLKDKGIATDEELASHLEQAGKASSVRWRGVRVRADYLFASAIKAAEQVAERESTKPTEPKPESKRDAKQSGGKEIAKGAEQAAESEPMKHAEPKPESKRDAKQLGGKETAKGAEQAATQNAANDQPDNDQPDNDQPENEQPENDKPESDEASAGVEQNVERDIERDVKQDRNRPVEENNRPSKNNNSKEKAA